MPIIIPETPKLTRRAELELEVAGLIEEAVKSAEVIGPGGLAGSILDLIEIEMGVSFDAPNGSAS